MASLMSNMMSNMMQNMRDMLIDFRAETREEIAQLRERVDSPLRSYALLHPPGQPTGERLIDTRPPTPKTVGAINIILQQSGESNYYTPPSGQSIQKSY